MMIYETNHGATVSLAPAGPIFAPAGVQNETPGVPFNQRLLGLKSTVIAH